MEQLIIEIQTYAARANMKPQAVIRAAINAKWNAWDGWVARTSSPTLATADRIRAWMAAHPVDGAADQPSQKAS
ncbi:hypothetical protein DL1_11845 [Thioclava dalianensis]|uniref:Uncharacterized protein n=1 Tax=Thioclava dalianensis TaxID=1185766 RepID=A0A074U160_9RHOB|nr:hypothetical protein [Thioclava dalianensis]KEP68402.1 hypothetical protein DL1_11845 [Thioclava dalianensis]